MGSFFYLEEDMAEALKEAKKINADLKCSTHNRKVLLSADYDNNGVNLYITRYCCLEFAKEVATKLYKAKLCDHIYIKNKKDSYSEFYIRH